MIGVQSVGRRRLVRFRLLHPISAMPILEGKRQVCRRQLVGKLTERDDVRCTWQLTHPALSEYRQDRNELGHERIDSNERIAETRAGATTEAAKTRADATVDAATIRTERAQQLTPQQKLLNGDIKYARRMVADLSPEEVKRRSQKFSATGRENPDYDPQMQRWVGCKWRIGS